MSPVVIRLAPLISALLCLNFSAAGAAEPLPVRKSGHWRITTVADSFGMKTFDTCIAPGDSIVSGIGDKACSSPDVKRIADEVFVNVTCKTGSGTELTSTLFTGDFKSWYRGTTKMTFDPPENGVPHMGVTIDATFIGAECPATTGGKRSGSN